MGFGHAGRGGDDGMRERRYRDGLTWPREHVAGCLRDAARTRRVKKGELCPDTRTVLLWWRKEANGDRHDSVSGRRGTGWQEWCTTTSRARHGDR